MAKVLGRVLCLVSLIIFLLLLAGQRCLVRAAAEEDSQDDDHVISHDESDDDDDDNDDDDHDDDDADDDHHGPRWSYESDDDFGPARWHTVYPTCGSTRQSPVNIDVNHVYFDRTLQRFDFSDYSLTEGLHMTLHNRGGHTVEVMLSGRELYLKGGSLPGTFQLKQFHFHWGHKVRRGSEHSFNGKFSAMEVHFVHALTNFTGVSPPVYDLAVLGFLVTIGRTNVAYEKIVQFLDQIINSNDRIAIPTFKVKDLLPPSRRYHYFRYNGSLTTPPCHETVIWSLGINRVEISPEQFQKFHTLLNVKQHHVVYNCRPIQDLNQRIVTTTSRKRGRANLIG